MIVSFSIANFRSFKAEQTLNLLASKRLDSKDLSLHCRDLPGTDEHVLRVASLYGANGAGKSNVVRALEHVKRLVLSGTPVGQAIVYEPFLLDEESPTQPSCFDLQFVQDETAFLYGFAHDAHRIHEEWLSLYEGAKERDLFLRKTDVEGHVTVELGDASHTPRKLKALAEVGARPNQLFLTEVINMNDVEAEGPRFGSASKWFRDTLKTIAPESRFQMLVQKVADDAHFRTFVEKLLQEADTGISGLDVRLEEPADSDVNEDEFGDEAFVRQDGTSYSDAGILRHFPEMSKGGPIKRRRITARHNLPHGGQVEFLLKDESDGCRRLMHLLPALYYLKTVGAAFVIDELERSIHPMLARKLIEVFVKSASDKPGQMIFTTHESTLLDLDLMRRDSIWFAEKDRAGATQLYSLADFKVRKDLRIEKGYLDGRFGAIPFLGGIDGIMEAQLAPEAAT